MLKEKKQKKAKKGGKKYEASEHDETNSEKPPEEDKQEEVKYAMGEQYDAELAALRKVDYEFEQLLAKAKVKALKKNEMEVYNDLDAKKMNKAALKIYLFGDDKPKDSIDMKELNKDWDG